MDTSKLTTSAPSGDVSVPTSEELFQMLYAKLHRLARHELRRNAMVTLSATELLHEAFLDLSKRDGATFPDRARFMAYAARAMRGLVIDYARERKAQKRGGEFQFTAFNTDIAEALPDDQQLSRIAEALDELATIDAPLAELVDLKFFCGLGMAEIAALRGVSARTVARDWIKARVYLRRTLNDDVDID
jgi:RNA polymerase sigma factor (TIGR02999 family)